MKNNKIQAAPSIRRLPSYLHIIKKTLNEGNEFISGTVIAEELHLEPIQVRKDLGITGIIGKPKLGYPVAPLIAAIEHFLGWDEDKNAVIIGAGNLATALTGYPQFKLHGLHFTAAFDVSNEKIGTRIHDVPILPITNLCDHVKQYNSTIAIITVPSEYAQQTADIIVKSGIKAIWNFTNVKLKLPENIIEQREDLTSGFAILCVKMNSKNSELGKEFADDMYTN